MSQRAFIGLGSNLGDRVAALHFALRNIVEQDTCSAARVSTVYETQPWGIAEQPEYLNAVVEIWTTESPEALLTFLLAVEGDYGRIRGTRWDARTLDIDLLAVGNTRSDARHCTLPHPRIAQRRFVVRPWAEIAADFVVPGYGSVEHLSRACDDPLSVRPHCCLWPVVASPTQEGFPA